MDDSPAGTGPAAGQWQSAARLTILLDEDDKWRHGPLYPEIVRRARDAGPAGASVWRGVQGNGASTRIRTTRILAVAPRFESLLPLGTLTVNIVGSALLGGLIGASANSWLLAAAGTGFCGVLTTFSTFGYETIRLAVEGAHAYAVGNVVLSVVTSLTAVYAAAATTRWLWP
ncbi:DUF190 domain-containing protein [Nocardia sp. CA-129566]|uniref:DUF190 domain-containing protein n=1 Tax=Nocardia sp. CA-129566 TaxID=3239976 RepID=UPI003D96FBFC